MTRAGFPPYPPVHTDVPVPSRSRGCNRALFGALRDTEGVFRTRPPEGVLAAAGAVCLTGLAPVSRPKTDLKLPQ